MNTSIQILQSRGWAIFRTGSSRKHILALAEELGVTIAPPNLPVLHFVKPRSEAVAPPNTYSGRFGLGEFPLHSDMANWTTPPRYVLLQQKWGDNSVPTMVAEMATPLQLVGISRLRTGVWIGRAKRRSFVCSLLSTKNGHDLFRWDPVTLKPLTEDAVKVRVELGLILNEVQRVPVHYDDESILVLDNWRVLHARPQILTDQHSRVLERVLVMEAN